MEDRFQERLRGAMEYLHFRNVSPETKRRVLPSPAVAPTTATKQ